MSAGLQQTPNREPHTFVPWTPEQVDALNFYQKSGVFHPFTSEKTGVDLIATAEGWVEQEGGPVVQDWAHWYMLDKQAIQARMDLFKTSINRPEK